MALTGDDLDDLVLRPENDSASSPEESLAEEISAMAAIGRALTPMPRTSRRRVLNWAMNRFVVAPEIDAMKVNPPEFDLGRSSRGSST